MRKLKAFCISAGLCVAMLAMVACGRSEEKETESEKNSEAIQVESNGYNKPDSNDTQQSSTQAVTEKESKSETVNNIVSTPEVKLVINGGKLGELQKMTTNNDYVIDGIFISSDKKNADFSKQNTQKEFKLGEKIELYAKMLDDSFSMNVYVVKNDDKADYLNMMAQDVEDMCWADGTPMMIAVSPDAIKGYVGSIVIDNKCGAGLYNIIFTIYDSPYYVVQIKVIE